MAEQSAGTAARTDASGVEVLLATKLYVPRLPPGFVSRPRLVSRLDEELARGLLLVSAPAGFGKTSLLADWSRRGERPVAWLSLDDGDNDPPRFWRHVVAALGQVEPELAGRLLPLLGPPAPPSFDALVAALINELAPRPADAGLAVVLDDYHLIGAEPVHSLLGFLLERRPPCLALVLASRADPPLPLARLRARGELVELRAADLRFTSAEAAAVLRETAGPGLSLPESALATLAARTEGWVAGLQLAGLSLRGQADAAGFVASFSGSNRYVLDFLAQEVLEGQPDQVRSFLLETSVLERLSGELCDHVTGRSGSQRLLEALERANLFLVPLDEARGWWRYHPLFADLLRARLGEEQPAQVARLHQSAAAWYEERGLANDAIRHAAAAGEMTWAARLIEQHFDELFYQRSEGATVERWLASVPAKLASSRPRLLLAQAAMFLLGGRIQQAEALLDAAERAFVAVHDEPFAPSAGRAGSLLANVPAGIALHRAYLAALQGDGDATAEFARRALAEIQPGEQMLRTIAQGFLAVAQRLRGRLVEAEHGFAGSVAGRRAAAQPTVIAWGCHDLSQVQRAQGRLDAAVLTCQQALEITNPAGQAAPPTGGPAHVELAEVAYQRDDLDVALHHVTEGIALCRRLVYVPPLAAGLVTLAWIRQAQGDGAGALAAMDEAGEVMPAPVPSVFNQVPVQRARLLLAQGDLAGALRWTRERRLDAVDDAPYHRENEYLVLARVLLAQDRPEQALPLLERLHTVAAAQGRTGSVIVIQALKALALAARGDQAGAVTAMAEALTLACPQRYLRGFADEGAPMGTVLGWLIAAQRAGEEPAHSIPLGCLGRLARCFQQHGGTTRTDAAQRGPAVPSLVEPLTEREQEILQQLAAGKPNQQIAKELVVSLDTVKKHVTHVLGKLGATNRTEATARARELGLLP